MSFATNSSLQTSCKGHDISKYSAFVEVQILSSKWGKERGECDMWKGRFKVICGVVE